MGYKLTKEDYDKVKNINFLDIVKEYGFTPKKKGSNYNLKEHDSFTIFTATNTYYHYSKGEGGSVIDFIANQENITHVEAVRKLLGKTTNRIYEKKYTDIRKDMILPEKYINAHRVFAYLNQTRGIAADVISFFMHKKMLYESEQNHNCVFVSYDENAIPKYATLRGTITQKVFKGDVKDSNKEYGFSFENKNSNKVIVFESPIDLMSYMTLYPNQNDNLLSLGCIDPGALIRFIRTNDIEIVSLLLDTDKAVIKTDIKTGLNVIDKIKNKITGINNKIIFENHPLTELMKNISVKDVNEYLVEVSKKKIYQKIKKAR